MAILSMVIFICLLVYLQRLIYKKYWDRGLSLRLAFSAKEAWEGETLTLTEELTNAKPLPLPWVTAKFQLSRSLKFLAGESFKVSDDYYQHDLFRVNMYQRVTRKLPFVCGRRGYYRIKSMDVGSSDILASTKLVKRLQSTAELTVLPKLIPAPEIEILTQQIQGDVEVRRFTNPDPFQFRGIREYFPRDDFRHINFKASARTGSLMVNQYGETATQELIILLNLETYADWEREEVYEEAIRIAASVAGYFSGLGVAVGLRCTGKDIATDSPAMILPGSGARHFHGVLEQLARIDLSLEPEKMAPYLENLRQPEPVYLLISPHHGKDITQAYEKAREQGLSIRWILPALKETKLRLPEGIEITRWDVDPSDYVL
ncbi:MAG: DUF58 domain-containing protein [Oscillospiraceae bacterium]|nr:DUF58 domain-containing protein [Oscillospiraceae bacterium]